MNDRTGMDTIVKTVARLCAAFTLLFGLYVVFESDRVPSGGTAGGVIAAASFILLLVSFGREGLPGTPMKRFLDPELLTGIAAAAILISGAFLLFTPAWFSRELADIILKLSTGAGVFAVIVSLALRRGGHGKDRES